MRDKAAELAGRTRDKIPVSEATILLGFIASDLLEIWNMQAWPELVPDPEQMAVTDRRIGKRLGLATELGDVLGVFTANPLATTRYRHVEWEEADGFIRVHGSNALLWVEYMLPAPDLLNVAAADLEATTIPRRFGNYLSMRAAGQLLGADGDTQTGAAWVNLAEQAMTREVNRLAPAPAHRRAPRLRPDFTSTSTTSTATSVPDDTSSSHTADDTVGTADEGVGDASEA